MRTRPRFRRDRGGALPSISGTSCPGPAGGISRSDASIAQKLDPTEPRTISETGAVSVESLQDEHVGTEFLCFRPKLDAPFDECLSTDLRALSEVFWTPMSIARIGAQWLYSAGARSVLDVGAGVGKFCTVASLTTRLESFGVEHRPHLVRVAREVATRLGAHGCHFFHGGLELLESLTTDAVYLYNPFGENLAWDGIAIDDSVRLSGEQFDVAVRRIEAFLKAAPKGKLALTFHGFGGQMPDAYRQIRMRPAGSDYLRLFEKTE